MRSGNFGVFPDGVALPKTSAEVQTLLQYAQQHQISVIPYGGGTSVVGHINPEAGDQDGYQMLNRDQIQKGCGAEGLDIKDLLIRDLRAAEPRGIAPVIEGRICQGEPGRPCLIPTR